MTPWYRWLLCICLLQAVTAWGGDTLVTYPADEVASDARHRDLLEILHTALEKTVPQFGPYQLRPSAEIMNEARYLLELKNGRLLNIAWSSTSIEKERDYLPIRIPLRKGLLGYRILLINKDLQPKLDNVHSIDDLKAYSIGQGLGWGDVALYRANGFMVWESSYDGLFPMTAAKRVDLFPRGVGEVIPEYTHYVKDNPQLAIEQHLLLYYPWPFYFFFNKKDQALHDRVEAGIRLMLKDGAFEDIFNKYNRAAIQQLGLQNRRIIKLNNPLLPPDTPLHDAALWFDPVSSQ